MPIRCGVPSLPCIVVTNRELRDLTEDALGAVQLANQPPTLFQRGGALTRLRHSDQQMPFLEVVPSHLLPPPRHTIARPAGLLG